MLSHRSVALLAGIAALGCAEVGAGVVPTGDAASAAAAPADTTIVPTGPHLTLKSGPLEVTTEGEQSTCTYTDVIAEDDLAVWATTGEQAEYGHHVTLYYTLTPKTPQQIPCFSADSMDKKLVAQAPTETSSTLLALPEGAAFRVPKGAQLIIFSHYVNASGKSFTTDDTLYVWLRDAASVTTWMDSFTFSVETFQVPPHSEAYEVTSTCTVDHDLQVLLFIGHMHELGKQYRLDIVDGIGHVTHALTDETWAPTFGVDPPVHWFSLDAPFFIKAGTHLRQTCIWSNPGDAPVGFPAEMCLAAFTYFPGQGELFCKPE